MHRAMPLLCLLMVLPMPARADPWCETLWLTRNAIFHRAGQCFASPLGQALFDNSRCIGTAQLAAADAAAVADLRRMESERGCRVATDRAPSARMRAEAARLARLRDIPVPDDFGWACLGYLGAGLTLHSGASFDSPVTGQAMAGTMIYSEHLLRNGWAFLVVTAVPGGPALAEGWTQDRIARGQCREEAG